jgi:hypothetical protein
MTVAANPLCQLASGTRSPSCVYCIRLRFSAAIKSLPLQQNQRSTMQYPAVFSTSGIDDRSQEDPLDKEMVFNRHNPSLDHRGR